MSTDQPPGMPPLPENKRKPPTIDLEATEVEAKPAADAAAAPEPAQEPPPAAKASAAEPPPPPPPPPRRSVGALIGAGIVGGAIAAGALVAANLYLAGSTSLDARLAGVEQRLRDLAARPWPAAGGGTDSRALDELTARVAKLEAAVANPRPTQLDPAVANRVSAIEGEIKAMAESVGILGRRTDEAVATAREARARADATAAALAELSQKLDRTAKAFEAALAKQQPGADRAGRLAIAAAVLDATVARGAPFAAELAAVKALGAEPPALAALEPFASTGLPSASALGREISELTPALLQAAGGPAREGGFLERLQVGAERLVRIRRVEEVAGSDPAAIIARIEVKAAHGDLAGALVELASLPEGARAPAAAWIKKAQARAAALDASRKLAADSLAGLSK